MSNSNEGILLHQLRILSHEARQQLYAKIWEELAEAAEAFRGISEEHKVLSSPASWEGGGGRAQIGRNSDQ